MPFCGYKSDRNYINKIINYNNLVSFKNSMTSIDELAVFLRQFISNGFYKTNPGIYNVVNEGSLSGEDVVNLLTNNNIINPNWKFVDIDSLALKAGRSNCILSTDKIKELGLGLHDIKESMDACIKQMIA